MSETGDEARSSRGRTTEALMDRVQLAEAEADRLRLKAIEDALRINNLLREVGRLEDALNGLRFRMARAIGVLGE